MKKINSKIRILTQLLKSKTMNTNYLKLAVLGLMMFAGSAINAQTTSGADNVAQTDKAGESIRLIDNKGTIKYMQSNNGITTITSTESGNKTTTTWQLGGSLVDNTYIDVDGKVFSLDGIKLISPAAGTASDLASTDATSLSTGKSGTATGTGWTVLIRDEVTGETSKILASDLIATGHTELTSIDLETAATTSFTGLTGLSATHPISKVSLFRNGAKLRAGTDYTITTAGEINIITAAGDVGVNDFNLYATDILEVHWIK